ncbi:unnamed protein product [Trichobilharzia szidati]|nr:unnamed protein product [Trichobilharzia szidati]
MDALDSFEELTELGYHICDIPIPAHYAKMVLVSVVLKCLDPILTIACILAYTEPFTIPRNAGERRDLMNARKKFSADTYSDHMMLLRAFQFWQKSRSEGWEKNFCQKNFISTTAFEVITAIRTQLLGQLRASGFVKARGSGDIRDLNSNSENWAVVKAAIVAGMHGNLARLDRKNSCLRIANGNNSLITLHPNSVIATNSDGTKMDLNNLPCDWLVFDEVLTLSNSNVKNKISADASDIYESTMSSNNEAHFRNTCLNSQQQNNPLGNSTENNKSDLKIIKCASIISPITVALMAGPIRLWPEMIKESQSNVNGFNPTKIPTEEAKQQRQQNLVKEIHQCQTVCSNTKNKNENNTNIIYGSAQEGYETESESDSDSETQGIVKSLLQNNNNNSNSNNHNNSQLSRIHMNIREVLGEIIQQKTKANSNSTDTKPKVDTPQAPTQPSDPIMNLSTNFNAINISDNKHSLKSLPIQQQHQQQQQSQLIPNLTYSSVDRSNPIMSMMSSSLSSASSTSTSANDQTNSNTSFCLDSTGFLRFILNSNEAQMVIGLRQKWHALFLRRLKNPGKQCSQQDEAVLNCLTNVLMAEEQALGLRQPSGVGARPRPMAAELCNQLDYSQNDTSQIPKISTEQSIINNKIASAHCITTESKAPITTITSPNTNQLDQDSLRCKYPLFTRPNYASQITNFTLLNDFNKTNKQGSFQASRSEQYMDKHTSIAPVMENTGNTGRLTSFPTANNSRCDCQACSDNPNYVLANPLTKLNIMQSEDKGTSSISNLNSNFSETPIHISLHGNQNSSLLSSLVNLNRVNSLEIKQQQQRQQQPYDHNEIQNNNNNNQMSHHHSLKWESINYSSNNLKESYRLNNLISNFATLSFPATSITTNNDNSSSSSSSNALISDHSLSNLNNRLSVTQTTNIWSSNNEADFKLLNYGINK